MPDIVYEGNSYNGPSQLSEGWHPSFLVDITIEDTPQDWERFKRSPKQWRWWVATWDTAADITRAAPEAQSTTTSTIFSPGGGKFDPSTCYRWHAELLGRRPAKGEHVNLNPMLPLPCRVKISRTDKNGQPSEYAKILDLERWPDGQALLTPDLRDKLATWYRMKSATNAPPPQASPAPPLPPPAPASPPPTDTPKW
jgi:hypothetical protein